MNNYETQVIEIIDTVNLGRIFHLGKVKIKKKDKSLNLANIEIKKKDKSLKKQLKKLGELIKITCNLCIADELKHEKLNEFIEKNQKDDTANYLFEDIINKQLLMKRSILPFFKKDENIHIFKKNVESFTNLNQYSDEKILDFIKDIYPYVNTILFYKFISQHEKQYQNIHYLISNMIYYNKEIIPRKKFKYIQEYFKLMETIEEFNFLNHNLN